MHSGCMLKTFNALEFFWCKQQMYTQVKTLQPKSAYLQEYLGAVSLKNNNNNKDRKKEKRKKSPNRKWVDHWASLNFCQEREPTLKGKPGLWNRKKLPASSWNWRQVRVSRWRWHCKKHFRCEITGGVKNGTGDAMYIISQSTLCWPPPSWILLGRFWLHFHSDFVLLLAFCFTFDSKTPYLSQLNEEENGFSPTLWPKP